MGFFYGVCLVFSQNTAEEMEVRLGEGLLPNKSSKNSKISDCISDVCSVPQSHHCVFLVRSITVTNRAFIMHLEAAEFLQPEDEMPLERF